MISNWRPVGLIIGCVFLFLWAQKLCAQDTLVYKAAPSGEALRILSMKINSKIPNSEKAPAFVLLSGGGWIDFTWFQLKDLARELSVSGAQGYVVEYRTSKAFPEATPMDALDDVHDAIYFLRENAESLNLDPDQIVIIGASVGGQMAFASTVANPRKLAPFSKYRPNYIVAYSPVLRNDSLGYGFDRIGAENSKWFSPWNVYMETPARIVPSLIFSGEIDHHIKIEDLKSFEAKARAKGDDITLVVIPNVGHSMVKQRPDIYEYTAPQILSFLEQQKMQFSPFKRSMLYFILGIVIGIGLFIYLVRRRRINARRS